MTYIVTIPIAGHIVFEVDAESEEEAKEKAMEADQEDGDATWDMLERFHKGNVCHCPSPWEVTVEEVGDEEEDDE